jgi:transposase
MHGSRLLLADGRAVREHRTAPTTRGKPRVDDRRVISGIVHVLKSGGRWVDAPDVYGPHKTLYNRFVRWAAKGIWVRLFQTLAQAGGPPAHVLMDSSAVKAHRSAAGGKGGAEAGNRALAGRSLDQDPRPDGSPVPPHRISAHGRPSGRLRGSQRASGAPAVHGSGAARRQGL